MFYQTGLQITNLFFRSDLFLLNIIDKSFIGNEKHIPAKVTIHAAQAMKIETLGILFKKSNPKTSANCHVQTV